MKIIALPFILLFFVSQVIAQPAPYWNNMDSVTYYWSAIVTSDNEYLIAGENQNVVPDQAILVKFNCSGQKLWEKNQSPWSRFIDVTETADHNYISVGDSGQTKILLVKSDTAGNVIWSKLYPHTGGPREIGKSVCVAHDGGYLIGATAISAPPCAVRILKTDPQGNIGWSKVYSGLYWEGAAVVSSPNLTYTFLWFGNNDSLYMDHLDSAGNHLWHRYYPGVFRGWYFSKSLIVTSDGGFAFACNAYIDTICLVKTDSSGFIQWKKCYPVNYYPDAHTITQTSDGGYLLTGDNDAATALRTDSAGNLIWNLFLHSTPIGSYGNVMFETPDSGYFYAGYGKYDSTFSTQVQSVARKYIDGTPCLMTSTEEITNESFFILYPNPTTGKLKIENEKLGIETIHVYNIFGEEVMTMHPTNEIDITSLPEGMYIIEVTGDNFSLREKILKTDY